MTGYGECVDRFFTFGFFELARRSGSFPPELIDAFEPVMQEECRYILLFANWVAWHRAGLFGWQLICFEIEFVAVWGCPGWERIGLARTMDDEESEWRGSRASRR
ncbi:hypothetical protein [Paraburkholderia sp. Ac-20342]|uniref:hypothetical protein n=1 Tax=Paraburkholderia sp. Ac-20342 TaxID=2703889 RepID=UPI001F11D27A|nr:hypothetical protein [Paraburkholderia sp. Ac-20342]